MNAAATALWASCWLPRCFVGGAQLFISRRWMAAPVARIPLARRPAGALIRAGRLDGQLLTVNSRVLRGRSVRRPDMPDAVREGRRRAGFGRVFVRCARRAARTPGNHAPLAASSTLLNLWQALRARNGAPDGNCVAVVTGRRPASCRFLCVPRRSRGAGAGRRGVHRLR